MWNTFLRSVKSTMTWPGVCVVVFMVFFHSVAWSQVETKVTADVPANGDRFGWSAGIDGIYAVVGAPEDDPSGQTDAGAAYVFYFNGSTWVQQAVLTADVPEANANFGYSVAISGEYIIVGAPFDDDEATNAGAAYVFHRFRTSWIRQAVLTASNAAASDRFGWSVDIDGEYAIVGAPHVDFSAQITNSGSAYVFHRDQSTWSNTSPQTEITAENDRESGALFGTSVAISRDFAIAGAPFENSLQGAAYIFIRDGAGNTWNSEDQVTASDGATGDEFGAAVAMYCDRAVIGAPEDDHSSLSSPGSAYVFDRSTNGPTWWETKKLAADDATVSAHFGDDVAITDNLIVVGAQDMPFGQAYVYWLQDGGWQEESHITASDGVSTDEFGSAVAIDGNQLLVGAWLDDINATDEGSAYFYELPYGDPCCAPWKRDGDDMCLNSGTVGIVGSLGVGTCSPESELHVKGEIRVPVSGRVRFGEDSGGDGEWIANSGSSGTAGLSFFEGFTERMRLTNFGQFGINEFDPKRHLHISTTSDVIQQIRLDQPGVSFWELYGGQGFEIRDNVGTVRVHVQNTTGDVGIGKIPSGYKLDVNGIVCSPVSTFCSDIRFKTNIQGIEEAIPSLLKLRGVTFGFRTDEFPDANFPKQKQIGFIAQELQTVFPELIYQSSDGYLSVDYVSLIPVLVEAIGELNAKDAEIDDLRNELNELKAQFEEWVQQGDEGKNTTNTPSSGLIGKEDKPRLFQNEPNPFDSNTAIRYYLPNTISRAELIISSLTGEQIQRFSLKGAGNGSVIIKAGNLSAGTYLYTLVIGDKKVQTMKMVLVN